MVKSHRSTLTLFHQWPVPQTGTEIHTPLKGHRAVTSGHAALPPLVTTTPGTPGSPSQLDPFGTSSTLPAVPTASRPPSTILSPSSSIYTPSLTHSATPKIILASPSSSTIHYLFPSETSRHFSIAAGPRILDGKQSERIGTVKRSQSAHSRSKSTGGSLIRPGISHRSSYEQSAKENSANQKFLENSFPLPPSRSTDSIVKNSPLAPLGSTKRVVSGSTARKIEISLPVQRSLKNLERIDPRSDMTDSMRVLRRQPSMADLGKGRGLQVEIERQPLGSSFMLRSDYSLNRVSNHASQRHEPISPRTVISPSNDKPVNVAEASNSTTVHPRRRSLLLTSPRPAPSPPDRSPVLPPPDFGNPLLLSDVVPSPSFSHLDYSTAGSSPSGPSRRTSAATTFFTKHASAIFPSSAQPSSIAMTRGETRRGLGSYDSGKLKAREDAARRLSGDDGARRKSSIARRLSLSRKEEDKKPRPRSQSLSTRSIREMGISPPVPPMHPGRFRTEPREPSDPARGIYLGDLSVDLGGRYSHNSSSVSTPSSAVSGETSLYPDTSPSSGFSTLPSIRLAEIRNIGGPRHPALQTGATNSSQSTLGLGLSPASRVSLPESLEAEAIDLTGTWKRKSAKMPYGGTSPVVLELNTPLPTSPACPAKEGEATRSILLEQNTFYLPPLHPKPALRATKSMGPGVMRRSFTSSNLASRCEEPTALRKSPSIVSRFSRAGMAESSTLSRFPGGKKNRPVTTFSICSPPDAIEPLPAKSAPNTEPTQLRSKPSSPFLTASASLRVFFGRDGFVARSLSGAFDRDPKSGENVNDLGLKSRISAPLVAQVRPVPLDADEDERNRQWREDVLSQAVSLSISSSLNRLTGLTEGTVGSQKASSSLRPRSGIPDKLISSVSVSEMGELGTVNSEFVGSRQTRDDFTRLQGTIRGKGGKSQRSIRRKGDELERLSEESPKLSSGALLEDETQSGTICTCLTTNTVKRDALGLTPTRVLQQIGRDESMASASVYSNLAQTLLDSPNRSAQPQSPPLVSRWSPSPAKKTKKSTSAIIPTNTRPIISPPLPLFTPTEVYRSGPSALDTPVPGSSLLESAQTDQVSLVTPAATIDLTSSVKGKVSPVVSTKSRLLGLMRREKNVRKIDVVEESQKKDDSSTQAPQIQYTRSPSTFSLALLKSPKSPKSPATPRSAGSPSASMRHAPISSDTLPPPRPLLEELTARDTALTALNGDEVGEKERAREERYKKVLHWREGVDEGGKLRDLEKKLDDHVLQEKEMMRTIARGV